MPIKRTSARTAFRVEWCSAPALADIAEEWRALAQRAIEPNAFYEPAFMLAALPVFGTTVRAGLVRTAAGRLAGLFPVDVIRLRGSLRPVLAGWTHPYAPLGTPLVEREDAVAIIAAWLDHLRRDRTVPRKMLLPLLPERGDFATALDIALARSARRNDSFGHHQRALLDPGAERAGYLQRSIPASRRKELRRLRRRLEESAPVAFVSATGSDDIANALSAFLALEAQGWKGRAGTAIAADAALETFVRRAVAGLAADGQARVDRLVQDGRTLAATVTLASGDRAWCWKIAYDESIARASPGVQLICDLTEDLTAAPEPAQVDSCATANHPMIDHIWRERLALCDRLIAVRPSMVPFSITCRIERLRRAMENRARAARHRLRRRAKR